ncbi:dihydrofolate reductase family protein [Senegalia sp. (in: firmicutes)]|uniref:dihydrofolate reductase family protein n=1 Tax=Senegalia sp. (in: firmicutes) TaxID=1924098 RepID=UPI003F95B47D
MILNKIFNSSLHPSNENTPDYIKEIYGDFNIPKDNRFPYLYGSLIMTLDGKIGFEDQNKSNEISKGNFLDPDGGLADLWVLNLLRTYSDGIIFGSKTLEVETNITGHIYDEILEKIRIEELDKKSIMPWNIIISRSGRMNLKHKIIREDDVPTIILTTKKGYKYILENIDKEIEEIRIDSYDGKLKNNKKIKVMYEENNEEFNINNILKKLKDLGLDKILVESPGFISILLKERLLNEMFINYSGLYSGGNLILNEKHPFSKDDYPGVDIKSIHMHKNNFLYMRQKLIYR